MLHRFNTKLPRVVGKYQPNGCNRNCLLPIEETLREERQFFNASPSFIQHHKGYAPLTHHILTDTFREQFEDDEYHHLQVNTYIHRLGREGLYANIPGWHCDYAKQEDEEERTTVEEDESVRHWIIVLGEDAPTNQFIRERDITIDFEGSSWVEASRLIDLRATKQELKIISYEPGDIVRITGNELYRSMPSMKKCWRYFFRLTHYPKGHPYRPQGGSPGHIRRLQMVYVDCHGGY